MTKSQYETKCFTKLVVVNVHNTLEIILFIAITLVLASKMHPKVSS